MGLKNFHSTYKILFSLHLKHSSFWPSAGVKHMSNDLVNAMPWQGMSALSMCIIQSLWVTPYQRCATVCNPHYHIDDQMIKIHW
jgi:hypothetical protein